MGTRTKQIDVQVLALRYITWKITVCFFSKYFRVNKHMSHHFLVNQNVCASTIEFNQQ